MIAQPLLQFNCLFTEEDQKHYGLSEALPHALQCIIQYMNSIKYVQAKNIGFLHPKSTIGETTSHNKACSFHNIKIVIVMIEKNILQTSTLKTFVFKRHLNFIVYSI
jgi:hypothetical protein